MVISWLRESWPLRVGRLKSLIVEQPDGPTWLWQMRIRILEFLIARYGSCVDAIDAAPQPEELEGAADSERLPRLSWISSVYGESRTEHPPKPRELIGSILDDIGATNDANRERCWFGREPYDVVWEWWRSEWCCPAEARN